MRVLVVLAIATIALVGAYTTQATHNSQVQQQFDLAIDTDTSGNDAATIGALDPCVAVEEGATFDVDVIVQGVPTPGVAGLAANIIYDPAVLSVVGDTLIPFMFDANGGPAIQFSDTAPDSDGDFRIDAVTLGLPVPTGDGVIYRLTFQALAEGGSTLTWDDDIGRPPVGNNGDGIPDVYWVDEEHIGDVSEFVGLFPDIRARAAEVVVGGACPGNLLDDDGDGFGDVTEDHTETLALQSCAQTDDPNDEQFDSWPVDFDDNQTVDVTDVLSFKDVFGESGDAYARHDLAPNGTVDVTDVLEMKPFFFESCTP